jgi:hypothetical protein
LVDHVPADIARSAKALGLKTQKLSCGQSEKPFLKASTCGTPASQFSASHQRWGDVSVESRRSRTRGLTDEKLSELLDDR